MRLLGRSAVHLQHLGGNFVLSTAAHFRAVHELHVARARGGRTHPQTGQERTPVPPNHDWGTRSLSAAWPPEAAGLQPGSWRDARPRLRGRAVFRSFLSGSQLLLRGSSLLIQLMRRENFV